MLAQVGRRMGWAGHFAWETPAAVFREHAALSAFENDGTRSFDIGAMATLDEAGYDAMQPFRWPLPAGATQEGGRLFAAGGFPTPDGRARCVPTPFRGLAAAPDAAFPLLLNTGRLRDQWHTMTRTGQVPRLSEHAPAPAATLSPSDAARLGAEPGGLLRLTSPHGATVLRIAIDPGQRDGEVFVPMHWTDAFTSSGPIDRLVGAAVDPLSGQPELKATPLRAEALPVRWRGLLLHRTATRPEEPGMHWSRAPVAAGHLLELIGAEPLPAEIAPLVDRLLAAPAGAERIHIADPARGSWRFATLVGGQVESCLFLQREGGRAGLPSGAALAALLDGLVAEAARPGLLAGRALAAKPAERNVCACFGVGVATIRAAILDRRLASVAEIGAALGAGTNCGSCVPELRELLRDAHEAAAA
ncbi:molybdopterin dinucleotide binding domain-containing protein [Dankookia sp. P2]|uniref:molybdopterin dinucleotide binding domain-containing protein n=1 Tax=Dankookia sp. P2 TaxID=3423955 RepID=UPI003D670066